MANKKKRKSAQCEFKNKKLNIGKSKKRLRIEASQAIALSEAKIRRGETNDRRLRDKIIEVD